MIVGRPVQIYPIDNSTQFVVATGVAGIGDLRLWVPEAIMSERGNCAVYPVGSWSGTSVMWRQTIESHQSIGPGNCPKVDDQTFECCGIRIPADQPVRWETRVVAGDAEVRFTIRLTNLGDAPIRKGGAAICLKFLDGNWWSDRTTWAIRNGQRVALAALGTDAGRANPFQAYLLADQTYDHVFYHAFWGINRHRVDLAVLVSENPMAGVCAGIEAPRAYFVHSNRGNPCTDVMVGFGDIGPGQVAEAGGRVWVDGSGPRDTHES